MIDHEKRAPPCFPGPAREGHFIRDVFVATAGFIAGSQRYNYGKENYKIRSDFEKRESCAT